MIETEIKLRWEGDPASARAHIEACGYRAAGLRLLEADQLFDQASGELRRGGQILRLRLTGDRAMATYKGPAEKERYKSREEIEFDVSDAAAFELVLSRLGYQRVFRYEKYRTTFDAGEGIVTLDETPIGIFMELEGPKYWIDATAAGLGFTHEAYLTASYASLYREYRARHAGTPADMVFPHDSVTAP